VKEEKYMALHNMTTHNATIERKDNSAILKLALEKTVLDIALTEDKPNDVKTVFNKLMEQLKNGEKEDLYFHICKEYIIQLNAELKSTYKELQDNGLLKTE
jgi:hypothetical protein